MPENLKTKLLTEEKVNFILDQVQRNQIFHDSCFDRLGDQAHKIQTGILVSASALIGFAISSMPEDHSPLAYGGFSMAFHLLACGGYLTWKGMRAGPAQALGNEPDHLLTNKLLKYNNLEFIAEEIRAKQEEITEQQKLNLQRGLVLNRTILATLLSPITFFITYAIATLIACAITSSPG